MWDEPLFLPIAPSALWLLCPSKPSQPPAAPLSLHSIEYALPRFGDIYSHSASVDLPALRPGPGCLLLPSASLLFFKLLRFCFNSCNLPGPYGEIKFVHPSVSHFFDRLQTLSSFFKVIQLFLTFRNLK
jgi:hypothetical protein